MVRKVVLFFGKVAVEQIFEESEHGHLEESFYLEASSVTQAPLHSKNRKQSEMLEHSVHKGGEKA